MCKRSSILDQWSIVLSLQALIWFSLHKENIIPHLQTIIGGLLTQHVLNPIWHGVKSNLFDMGGGHLAPPLYFPNEKSYILNIAYITSLGYLLSEYTPLYPRVTWQNCWRCIFQTLSAKIRENPNFLAQKWVSFDKKVNPLVQTWKVGNRDWKHSINAPFHKQSEDVLDITNISLPDSFRYFIIFAPTEFDPGSISQKPVGVFSHFFPKMFPINKY